MAVSRQPLTKRCLFLLCWVVMAARLYAAVSSPETYFNCPDIPNNNGLEQWANDMSGGSHHYDGASFLFGEEFEFWIDKPLKEHSLNTSDGQLYDSNIDAAYQFIDKWVEAVEAELEVEAIEDYSIDFHSNKKIDTVRDMMWVDIRIGNWSSKVYLESWVTTDEKALILLEVNVSPYRIHQKFTVGTRQYSAYQLFDHFVFKIAGQLNLRTSSGHKHLDLVESVAGNQELIFRMLVDVENKAWLSRVWGCEHDSGLQGESFVYRSQAGTDQCCTVELQTLVDNFNRGLLAGQSGLPRSPVQPHKTMQQLMNIWRCHLGKEQLLPAEVRMASFGDPTRYSNQQAKNGEVVVHPLSGTMEFRFLPPARSGGEVYLVNLLLRGWFNYHASSQKACLPVVYQPHDPLNSDLTSQQLMRQYARFLGQLGLNSDIYQIFRRQGCARSYYDLYERPQEGANKSAGSTPGFR